MKKQRYKRLKKNSIGLWQRSKLRFVIGALLYSMILINIPALFIFRLTFEREIQIIDKKTKQCLEEVNIESIGMNTCYKNKFKEKAKGIYVIHPIYKAHKGHIFPTQLRVKKDGYYTKVYTYINVAHLLASILIAALGGVLMCLNNRIKAHHLMNALLNMPWLVILGIWMLCFGTFCFFIIELGFSSHVDFSRGLPVFKPPIIEMVHKPS